MKTRLTTRRTIVLAGVLVWIGSIPGCGPAPAPETIVNPLADRFAAALQNKDLAAARGCLSKRGQAWATDEKLTQDMDAWQGLTRQATDVWGQDCNVRYGKEGQPPSRSVIFRRLKGNWTITAISENVEKPDNKTRPMTILLEPDEILVIPGT